MNRRTRIRSISSWCSRCQGLSTCHNDHALLGFTSPALGGACQSLARRGIWERTASDKPSLTSSSQGNTSGRGQSQAQRPWPDLSCLHGSRSAGKTTAMHVPIAMVHGCGTTVRCCGRARGPVGRCLLLRVSSVDHFGAVGLAPLSRGSKDSAMRGRCDSCLLSLPPSGLFQEGRTHTSP